MSLLRELRDLVDKLYQKEEKREHTHEKQIKLYPPGSKATAMNEELLHEAVEAKKILHDISVSLRLVHNALHGHEEGYEKPFEAAIEQLRGAGVDHELDRRIERLKWADKIIHNVLDHIKRAQHAGAPANM